MTTGDEQNCQKRMSPQLDRSISLLSAIEPAIRLNECLHVLTRVRADLVEQSDLVHASLDAIAFELARQATSPDASKIISLPVILESFKDSITILEKYTNKNLFENLQITKHRIAQAKASNPPDQETIKQEEHDLRWLHGQMGRASSFLGQIKTYDQITRKIMDSNNTMDITNRTGITAAPEEEDEGIDSDVLQGLEHNPAYRDQLDRFIGVAQTVLLIAAKRPWREQCDQTQRDILSLGHKIQSIVTGTDIYTPHYEGHFSAMAQVLGNIIDGKMPKMALDLMRDNPLQQAIARALNESGRLRLEELTKIVPECDTETLAQMGKTGLIDMHENLPRLKILSLTPLGRSVFRAASKETAASPQPAAIIDATPQTSHPEPAAGS